MPLPAIIPAALKAIPAIASLFGNRTPRPVYVEPTDPNAVAADTISGNVRNLGRASELASSVTSGLQEQANALIERALPGYSGVQSRLMARATEALDNPYAIPTDVEADIAQRAAERGVSVGGRGQFGQFSALRDFGLSALAYGSERLSQAQSMLSLARNLAPVVSPVSPLAFLPSVDTALEVDLRNKSNRQAVAQGGANSRAAAANERVASLGNPFGAFAALLQNIPIPGANDPRATSSEAGSKTFGGRTPTGQRVIPGQTVPY